MPRSTIIYPLAGELTLSTIEEMEARLFPHADKPKARLVVDLKHLRIMTTPGIGLMLELQKRTKSAGGSFALARLSPHILELFERTQLTRVLTIVSTLDEAVDRLSES